MAIGETVVPLVFFSISVVLSLVFTKAMWYLAKRFNVVDMPDQRKLHHSATPTLGGIAIFLSFFISFLGVGFLIEAFPVTFSFKKLCGFAAGAVILLGLGLYDDLRGVSSKSKVIIQIVSVLCLITIGGIYIDRITNPIGDTIMLPRLGIVLTIFWVLLFINAVNLIDGMDGLAAGICTIALVSVAIICAVRNEMLISYMAAAVAGSTLGFLKYNFYPAKIFMGDTGSLFLGYTISVMAIISTGRKASIAVTFLIPIIAMGLPIADAVFAFFRRLSRKTHPFTADKEHIHHRLLSLGLPYRQVLYIFYILSAYLGITAYILSIMPKQFVFWVFMILLLGGLILWTLFRMVENHIKKLGKKQ